MERVEQLRPLLAAEAAAEAYGAGVEPAELEQAVWLRLLERTRDSGPPPQPARWLRHAVRAEGRGGAAGAGGGGAGRGARGEVPYARVGEGPPSGPEPRPAEQAALTAEAGRAL